MKKSAIKLISGVFLVILLGIVLFYNSSSKPAVIRRVERDEQKLHEIAEQIIIAGEVGENAAYHGYSIDYYPSTDMVEVTVKAGGFGSSTYYSGFYFSPKDEPLGFQGIALNFSQDGSGWRWDEPEGDNWEYTEKICDNWYWFEMHF